VVTTKVTIQIIEIMSTYSLQTPSNYTIEFGKYKGDTLNSISNNQGFINWAMSHERGLSREMLNLQQAILDANLPYKKKAPKFASALSMQKSYVIKHGKYAGQKILAIDDPQWVRYIMEIPEEKYSLFSDLSDFEEMKEAIKKELFYKF